MPHVEAAHAGQTKLTLKGVQLFSRVLHQLSCPEKQGEMSDQILPATALLHSPAASEVTGVELTVSNTVGSVSLWMAAVVAGTAGTVSAVLSLFF